MSTIDMTREDYKKYIKELEGMAAYTPTTYGGTTSGSGSGLLFGGPLTAGTISATLGVSRREKVLSDIIQDGYWVKATGSRVTKDGFTHSSDWDYVVFDPDQSLYHKLVKTWSIGGSGNGTEFVSLRQDDTNLILVDKEETWKKWIIATNLIKTLNSKTKEERVKVFDSVFGKDKNAHAVDFGDTSF